MREILLDSYVLTPLTKHRDKCLHLRRLPEFAVSDGCPGFPLLHGHPRVGLPDRKRHGVPRFQEGTEVNQGTEGVTQDSGRVTLSTEEVGRLVYRGGEAGDGERLGEEVDMI